MALLACVAASAAAAAVELRLDRELVADPASPALVPGDTLAVPELRSRIGKVRNRVRHLGERAQALSLELSEREELAEQLQRALAAQERAAAALQRELTRPEPEPRIVRVDDFMLEAIPQGPTLLIFNNDRPGVVGRVGTLLGEAHVNISRMQLALKDGEAAMLVNVDPAPSDEVVEALRAMPEVTSATLLDLGE